MEFYILALVLLLFLFLPFFQKAFKGCSYTGFMPKKPLDLIHGNLNNRISVQLKDGREIVGILIGYDLDFNLTIDRATLFEENGKKGLGKIVLRHNNVVSIQPS
jgi:small nuclear ribonucleoprotein (snRNP)-like protein